MHPALQPSGRTIRHTRDNAGPTYVFVLCPPFCGSTVLWRILATSEQTSCFEHEGQFLPEVREAMRAAPWDADHVLPWATIKSVWERHWDRSKPYLVEKSPPNLIRTRELQRFFQPARFLVMARNPYAHAEGLMRHNGWDAARAAKFAAFCLERQYRNATELEQSIHFRYEDLTERPASVCQAIAAFLPGIGPLHYGGRFAVHSVIGGAAKPLRNLNGLKLRNLAPRDLATVTECFRGRVDVLRFWNYALIEPSASTTRRVA